ncbi:MAG: Gfo/Idh/MocA family oxidoreductase [Chloroherpetonaceae bacterium]|nr:Gfo/Idh/MocA family oxidoreductase [Chthonomonadaceae bacterium]MDW8207155.1 Gfo/Idh/MocA family oxidoreductase [Chloroherpetonaceae bacterium]
MSENKSTTTTSRREFLRNSAATVAAGAVTATVMPTTAEGMRRVLGANERIQIAHVGVGGQGMAHIRLLKENSTQGLKNNTESIAVCDLYVRRKKGAQAYLQLKDNQAFDDYRKLLDSPLARDIDAVWIATSDNWHAPIARDSMLAGKHVYIEKPMCKTVEEAFELLDTAKRTKRIVQVGSQGCSDLKWHAAGKLVKEGRIGKAVLAQGSYCRNSRIGEWNYYHIDPDAGPQAKGDGYVDWETFRRGVGPAEWDPHRFFRWRKYYAYGNGIVGDLFPHRLHPLMIAMALPQDGTNGYPMRVSSNGGIYGIQKREDAPDKPDREVPDLTTLVVDFEGGPTIMLLGSTVNEQGLQDMIRGTKGTIYFGGNTVEIKPERVWAEEVEEHSEQAGDGERIETHQKNFLDCIRNGGVPNCNIELATRVQVMISLGDLAYQKGKTYHFDPKTRKYWA